MKVIELAVQAAGLKGWPLRQDPGGDVRIEVPTGNGRSQVVTVSAGADGDGDPVGFVWSSAGDAAGKDPWALLRANEKLTYGKFALRGSEVVVVQGVFEASAALAEVGKAIYYAARAADELEAASTGTDRL